MDRDQEGDGLVKTPVFCIERYPLSGGCRPGGSQTLVWCGAHRWPSRYMSSRAAKVRVKEFPTGVCAKCLNAQAAADGWMPIADVPRARRLIWLSVIGRELGIAYSDTLGSAGFSAENTPTFWRPAYEDERDVDGSPLRGREGAWPR